MATDRSAGFVVEGLRETLTAFRKLSGETPKEVSKYHKDVARFVGNEARRRADSRPRGKQTGHISRSIKERGTQREAAVRVTAADARVQEFGGRAPLFGNKDRWFQVREKQRSGYFLYPAVRDSSETVQRFYLRGLDNAIRSYWNK
jgi:hypothetical protein